jgi:hypothetical protein
MGLILLIAALLLFKRALLLLLELHLLLLERLGRGTTHPKSGQEEKAKENESRSVWKYTHRNLRKRV